MNGIQSASHTRSKSFRAKVVLSRPAYRLGSTVVGTIRLLHPLHTRAAAAAFNKSVRLPSLRDDVVDSAVVYVAGFCKVDSRWHEVSSYSKMYGPVHPMLAELHTTFDPSLLFQGEDTVCFWATNGLQLLSLDERQVGAWTSSPTVETDDEYNDGELHQQTPEELDHSPSPSTTPSRQQLAFTFRVDIPPDLPPSINATTCRYFYSVEVLLKTKSGEQTVVRAPFAVWTDPHQPLPKSIRNGGHLRQVVSSRVKIGTCTGMAHSIGLPCHISATERHRPRGQMTVQPSPLLTPSSYPSMMMGSGSDPLQILRVTNPQGRPVCVLTVVGATKLTPGSRIHIKWDFPTAAAMKQDASWVPCHQVSAALMGEEMAVYEDGTKKRTRSFVFDTCHELVEPGGGSDLICKYLFLPMDAPCSVCTDIMELFITCQIDITTVAEPSSTLGGGGGGGGVKLSNLKLELPCHVVQNMDQEGDDYDFEVSTVPLKELLTGRSDRDDSAVALGHEFGTNDILPDLKLLALHMDKTLRKEAVEVAEDQSYSKLRIV
jgi:hypothetical protein